MTTAGQDPARIPTGTAVFATARQRIRRKRHGRSQDVGFGAGDGPALRGGPGEAHLARPSLGLRSSADGIP
jgi:hypothetical protein